MKPLSAARLIGTWRSDKSETLAHWSFSETATAAFRAWLANALGKLTVRYTDIEVQTEFGGNKTACSYRVIASDEDSIELICLTENSAGTEGIEEKRLIHFLTPDMYWIRIGTNKEFFRRID